MRSQPLAAAVAALAVAGLLAACADAGAPDASPDVLAPPPAAPAHDSSAALSSDTLAAGRLRGTVVVPSRDSTVAWRRLANARIEVATRDARGAMAIVATTTSDSLGAFALPLLATPPGLLFLRATPSSSELYRPTDWLAAYAFTGPWATTTVGDARWTLGPYVVVERADAPVHAGTAPMLLVGQVVGDDGRTGLTGATVVLERLAPPEPGTSGPRGTPVSLGVAASARTDVNGQFMLQVPSTALYGARVVAPAGSSYADVPLREIGTSATGRADVIGFDFARFQLGRR